LARRTKEGPRGYPVRTRQLTLAEPTDDGEVVAQVAKSLLEDALAEPVRLLGVGVSGLVDEGGGAAQLSLFDTAGARAEADPRAMQATPKKRQLNQALDALADRFGDDVVRRASQGDARHATLSGQWKRGSRDTDRPVGVQNGDDPVGPDDPWDGEDAG
ncbi:MAG: hypothetical protein AAGC67_07800, partial [Myxococcota bacterium]